MGGKISFGRSYVVFHNRQCFG